MSRFSKQMPRVLVMLPTVEKSCRDKLQGIMRYAHIHGPWNIQVMDNHPHITRLGSFSNWSPDGIIWGGISENLTHIPRTDAAPVVWLDIEGHRDRSHSSVSHDSKLIAETAANHFLSLGLSHFAFVGSVPATNWSAERGQGFADHLRKLGHACHLYTPVDTEDWGLEQKHMLHWLRALPKPCGLMAALDLRARQVLDTCLMAGLRVPGEIVVVGVDNDIILCENTTPTLSSVLPDFEGGGYLAAKVLDELLRGTLVAPVHLSYSVRELVQRSSSLYLKQADWLAQSAVEFIRKNACSGIAVPDVASHLKVSRRYAERHFRAVRGHSILTEIQSHRMERVCALLRETNLRIGEIGRRCGYNSENYLKALFKKRYGLTMSEFRRRI